MATASSTESPATTQVDVSESGEKSPPSAAMVTTEVDAANTTATPYKREFRFWAIIFALCITSLLAAVENTVIVTSLPTIVAELDIGQNYVWIGNIFFLTSAALQPLFGQVANLFGRRNLSLFVVAVYILGSGICGGANSPAMLIAGRAVQGIGSGGIYILMDVIISDLVPLRERGYFISIILAVYGIGIALGPSIGGVIVQTTTWRWVFYLNLPIGGVAWLLLFFFLHVKWDKTTSPWKKLRRIDYAGNALLIASTISVLIALTWADVVYPWSSYRVLVPFILGLLGVAGFFVFESLPFVTEAVIPVRLFSTWSSIIVYINTFVNSALLYWIFFYLPLYFQAVRLATPAQSGVDLLVACLVSIPGASIAAFTLAKFGRYKIMHVCGFALFTLGLGLFGMLDQNTSTAAWVWINIVPAIGSGMLLNTQLPAFQAAVEERDQATATASWSFIRAFGNVWGVAIPSAIFNHYCALYADSVDDPAARAALQNGQAFAGATKAFVESFDEPVRQQLRTAFMMALSKVFLISLSFAGFSLVLSILQKEVKLRTELETEFGLEERKEKEKMQEIQSPV